MADIEIVVGIKERESATEKPIYTPIYTMTVTERRIGGLLRSHEETVKLDSLKILKGYLDGIGLMAKFRGLSVKVEKPEVRYVYMPGSSMYQCPLCYGLDGIAENLHHKSFCPNHIEGKPFTPDFEHY